jgi:S1-C subfamily serine protease
VDLKAKGDLHLQRDILFAAWSGEEKVAGVAPGGPAEQAGVQGGDVIVELAGKPIENIDGYTYTLNTIKLGVPTTLVVLRGRERLTLMVTPGSRA